MKLYLSYVAARERSSGRVFFLAETNALHPGAASAQVAHIAEMFRAGTPDGGELRAKYSHVLVIIDNHERQSFEFPDPVKAEVEMLQAELAAAEKEAVVFSTAAEQARLAASTAKSLEKQRDAASKRVDELQAALADARSLLPAVPVVAPVQGNSHESAPQDEQQSQRPSQEQQRKMLEDATDEELLKLAANYGLDTTTYYFEAAKDGSPTLDRDTLIEAILVVAT